MTSAGQTDPLWEIPGNCWQLFALRGRPHALLARVSHFSFGTNAKLLLVDSEGDENLLYDGTLAPGYGRALDALEGMEARLSTLVPPGDILVYAEPHDPPADEAYLRLVARHLESGHSWPLARVPWTLRRLGADASGEIVITTDNKGQQRRFDIWGDGELPKVADQSDSVVLEKGLSANDARWLQLRSWRARGLIDAEVYRRYRQRMAQP
ncbi:MAG: hypothetical protein D6751_07195 [Deltaproteobacteria bacterium]|nr:MAG: hypothetical protein D6751_07195 [Deltaproteobacteria bacterium]